MFEEQIAQIFDLVPNLLPHFGGLVLPQLPHPQTDNLIAKSGEKHKFSDFEAQIAQTEHKFFDPCLTSYRPLGAGEMEPKLGGAMLVHTRSLVRTFDYIILVKGSNRKRLVSC